MRRQTAPPRHRDSGPRTAASASPRGAVSPPPPAWACPPREGARTRPRPGGGSAAIGGFLAALVRPCGSVRKPRRTRARSNGPARGSPVCPCGPSRGPRVSCDGPARLATLRTEAVQPEGQRCKRGRNKMREEQGRPPGGAESREKRGTRQGVYGSRWRQREGGRIERERERERGREREREREKAGIGIGKKEPVQNIATDRGRG